MINGKIYIGSTINLAYRKYQHFTDLRRNKHFNSHLQFACNKYGIDNFEYFKIEQCSPDILLQREDFYIQHFKSMDRNLGYNLNTAERPIMSEETKRKISKSVSLAMTGRKHSNKTKQKIAKSLSGKYNILYGKHLSNETKKKISESVKQYCKTRPKPSELTKDKISKGVKKYFESQATPDLITKIF